MEEFDSLMEPEGEDALARMTWNEFYVRCPFFIRDDGREQIRCTGVCDGHQLVWDFDTIEDYKTQLRIFCKDHFDKCEVYRMLKEVYED